MTDESSRGQDSASPWAGEVPVPDAPVEFTWASSGARSADADEIPAWSRAGSSPPAAPGGPTGFGLTGPPIGSSPLSGPDDRDDRDDRGPALLGSDALRRPRSLVVAGIGVVLLLAVGWLVFGRGGGSDESEATSDDSVPAVTEPGDSLPTVDEPEETDPDDTEPDESDPDGDSGSGTGGPDEGDALEWSEDTMELPQVLLDADLPFELVALTSQGDYLEIDVPSGRVRTAAVGRGIDGRVIAGETSTLFVSYSSTYGARLLRSGGPLLELDLPSNVDVGRVGAFGDEFAGIAYGNNGDISFVRVTGDGGVVTTTADPDRGNYWQQAYTADGSRIVSEAGGVYVEGDDGFSRISDGILISASTNHLLVRECDESMTCGYATIASATGDRAEVVIDDDVLASFGFDSAQVSPDGRWLRYVSYQDDGPEEYLIDLTTGEQSDLRAGDLGDGSSVWAADSSGFFRRSSMGIEFLVVETGESITFGEEFGRILSFDIRVRRGAATPAEATPTTTGLSLIAYTETGDIARIDVDTGAVITTDGPEPDSSAPVTIFPDPIGAIIASFDDVSSLRFVADEREVRVLEETRPGGPMWPGPVPGSVWEPVVDPSLAFRLVDALGTELDQEIAFDGLDLNDVVGSDGRGGIVVELELGGVFVVSSSAAPQRITSGELLAIGTSVAYVRECDDALQCGVFAVDRATGTRVPADGNGFDRAGAVDARDVPSGQSVSPDGTIVLLRDSDDRTRCLMIDAAAADDTWTGVPCVDLASPVIWTPDSGYAVWLQEGRVAVYERSTRSIRVLNTVELRAIAPVPAEVPPSDDVVSADPGDDIVGDDPQT